MIITQLFILFFLSHDGCIKMPKEEKKKQELHPLDILEQFEELHRKQRSFLQDYLSNSRYLEDFFSQLYPFEERYDCLPHKSITYTLIHQLYQNSIDLSNLLANCIKGYNTNINTDVNFVPVCQFIVSYTTPLYVKYLKYWEWAIQAIELWNCNRTIDFQQACTLFTKSCIFIDLNGLLTFSNDIHQFPVIKTSSSKLIPYSSSQNWITKDNDVISNLLNIPLLMSNALDKLLYSMSQRINNAQSTAMILSTRSSYSNIGKLLDKYSSQLEIMNTITTPFPVNISKKVSREIIYRFKILFFILTLFITAL